MADGTGGTGRARLTRQGVQHLVHDTSPVSGGRLAEEAERRIPGRVRAAGHWGVPMMVFGGEPFFGQDRIDQLVWRLRQAGLHERQGA